MDINLLTSCYLLNKLQKSMKIFLFQFYEEYKKRKCTKIIENINKEC